MMTMRSIIVVSLVVTLSACMDAGHDRLPALGTADPAEPGTIVVQPSCSPRLDAAGGEDDGASCDAINTEPDVICDIVPDPNLYCVTCNGGPTECMEYPPDVGPI
jgi:hypothetical protein